MNFFRSVRGAAAAVATIAALASVSPSMADDAITDSHLKAAREAIAAIHATDMYDGILPGAAEALKRELIQKNPDLSSDVTSIVDAKALALAARRADLEKEAAAAYAKSMSEEDLKAIADFYNTPAGKKLLEQGPIVTRDVAKAAQIWQNGIARDLAQDVGKAVAEQVAKSAPAQQPAEQGGDQKPAAQDDQAPAQ